MNDRENLILPKRIPAIELDTLGSGFSMASDHQTGSLLRTLVATKRGGRVLELGTGTGLSTCWMLDGMDAEASLTTVDIDLTFVGVAQKHLSGDDRVKFHVRDGSDFLRGEAGKKYDFIFADTWPGKYWDLDLALGLLEVGGLYVIDDMLPQENWPEDHPSKVSALLEVLEGRDDLVITKLAWSTGIVIATKK